MSWMGIFIRTFERGPQLGTKMSGRWSGQRSVWPKVCSVWTKVWTRVWPTVWRKSVQSGQWWSKSVWSGQGWPKSVRSGQYLSLGMVGLANACLGYGWSGQCLSWVADFILGDKYTSLSLFLPEFKLLTNGISL